MQDLVDEVSRRLENLSLTLVTAESCTGGMIAAAMTARPGASQVFDRGFISYTDQSKAELLGVPDDVIEKHGAVSAKTAIAMARGALRHSHADIALSVTGIAGPDGGTKEKPVGLVYIGYAFRQEDHLVHSAEHRFTGNRSEIRQKTVDAALNHILKFLDTLA